MKIKQIVIKVKGLFNLAIVKTRFWFRELKKRLFLPLIFSRLAVTDG